MKPKDMIGKTIKLNLSKYQYYAMLVAYVGKKNGRYLFIALSESLSKDKPMYLYLKEIGLDNYSSDSWDCAWILGGGI